MRDFIFRIWDIKAKKYIMTGSLYACEGVSSLSQPFDRNFIIEQYTGMLDKNGVRIFENDIIEINELNDKYKSTVIWSGFGWYESEYGMPFGALFDSEDVEVVGNANKKKKTKK